MRAAVLVVMLGVAGCPSAVQQVTKPTQAEGATNRRGIVKYFVSGVWTSQDEARRQEALKAAEAGCGGPYRIVDEDMQSRPTGAYASEDWVVIKYECVEAQTP